MHPNPAFRGTDAADALALARERGFGTLAVSTDGAPLLSHVPFVFEDDRRLALHLVRSNPIARRIKGETPARIAVSGPDSYVSPDWYGVPGQVPTWNYVAVHLTGRLVPLEADALRPQLEALSANFEERLAPKPEWTLNKMTDSALEKLLRMILPFRFEIDEIDSTVKLNQNKPDAVRLSAADYVDSFGIGSDTRVLAALMRAPMTKDTP